MGAVQNLVRWMDSFAASLLFESWSEAATRPCSRNQRPCGERGLQPGRSSSPEGCPLVPAGPRTATRHPHHHHPPHRERRKKTQLVLVLVLPTLPTATWGQGGMLAYNTGLAEVELPAEERLRVIAETERALAAAQKKRAQAEADAAALAEREAEAQGAIGGESGVVTEAGASGDAVRFSGSSVAADFTKHRRAFSYKMRSKGASARLFRRKEEARRLRARGEHARADAMEKDAEEEARRAMVAAQEAERKALHWEDEHHGGGEEEAGAASNRASASDEQLFNRIKGRTYMRRRG